MMRVLLTAAVLSAIVTASVGNEHRTPWRRHDPRATSGTETFHHTRCLNRPRRTTYPIPPGVPDMKQLRVRRWIFQRSSAGTCGEHIEASRGTITSPNFPHSYPASITCHWLITAPPSFYVVLNFTNFELESNEKCDFDKVTIYTEDKDGTDDTYGPFCGSTLPPQITSKMSKLRLHFSSDYSNQMSGFRAVFHVEPSFDTAKVELSSSTYPNGSVLLSWAWHDASLPGTNYLAGYYLRGASTKHTFQKTLSPLMTNYTANCLHGYTEYEISLQPFFKVEDSATAVERLGEVAMVKVKTPATAPGPPTEVVLHPLRSHNESGLVELHIAAPVAWNSHPIGFRVRWEPAQAEEAAWQELEIPDGSADAQLWTFRLNATRSLKPGRHYILFVSAQGHGDFGDILTGPEMSQGVTITPQGPVNLTAGSLNSTRAAITWIAPSPAEYFLVNVNTTIAKGAPDAPPGLRAKRSGCGVQANPMDTFQLEGSSQEWSQYSLPLLGLRPLCKYWVNVQACSTFMCSDVVVVEFEATQKPLRAPSFTTVEAVGADSIQLQWKLSLLHYADVPQYEIRLYDGERFRSHRTTNTSLRVINLVAETTYEVEIRAFFEGTRQMGPPATTSVTTWSLRPLEPTIDVKLDDGSDVVIMSWTFLNSTVSTLQVDNGEHHWQDCSAVAECTYTVQRGWNSSFKTGFLEMRNSRRAANYTLLIRGCNSHGCGPSAVANVRKGVPEPDEVVDLGFIQFDNSSGLLNWSVRSDHPAEYIASWQCDDGEHFGETTTNLEVEVTGLPPETKECTFSVTAFRRLQRGEEVHGKTSTIFVSLANEVI
ncbi:uncharacterized protein LOC144152890 isoform X2 [Haemaphysalis longicornis]